MNSNPLEFWKKEEARARHILHLIESKNWDCLPPDYEKEQERAIKFFKEEIEHAKERIKELKNGKS